MYFNLSIVDAFYIEYMLLFNKIEVETSLIHNNINQQNKIGAQMYRRSSEMCTERIEIDGLWPHISFQQSIGL